jgi:hypothetical protein
LWPTFDAIEVGHLAKECRAIVGLPDILVL